MEIISQVPIREVSSVTALIFAAILITIYLSVLIISTNIFRKRNCHDIGGKLAPIVFIGGMIMLFFALIFAIVAPHMLSQDTGRCKYVARLSDEYSANELFRKYDNITYDGYYYYFEDKNEN